MIMDFVEKKIIRIGEVINSVKYFFGYIILHLHYHSHNLIRITKRTVSRGVLILVGISINLRHMMLPG